MTHYLFDSRENLDTEGAFLKIASIFRITTLCAASIAEKLSNAAIGFFLTDIFFCDIVPLMQFTAGQYDKLSNLFLDLAKAMFITAFAAPAISLVSVAAMMRSLIAALVFTGFSLFAIKRKEKLI